VPDDLRRRKKGKNHVRGKVDLTRKAPRGSRASKPGFGGVGKTDNKEEGGGGTGGKTQRTAKVCVGQTCLDRVRVRHLRIGSVIGKFTSADTEQFGAREHPVEFENQVTSLVKGDEKRKEQIRPLIIHQALRYRDRRRTQL